MIRAFSLLTALGLLTACAQYQEPEANCFSFLAAVAPVEQDCQFTPIGDVEGYIEV